MSTREAPPAVRLTREELYALVWSEPMRTLAERFAISDVGLAKTCKRLNVPVPGLGYWRRKETGHPVRRTPLPHLPPHVHLEREVTLTRRIAVAVVSGPPGGITPVTGVAADGPAPGRPVSRAAAQAAYEAGAGAEPAREVVVAATLEDAAPLHPLVERTARALRKAKPDAQGLLTPAAPALAVMVTAASVDRTLRILDALCKALEARGYRVTDEPPPPRSAPYGGGYGYAAGAGPAAAPKPFLRVLTGETPEDAVEVTVTERVAPVPEPEPPTPPPPDLSRRSRRPAPLPAYTPYRAPDVRYAGTGALVLALTNVSWLASYVPRDAGHTLRQSWADGAKQRLERVLPSFIVGLVAAGEARAAWRRGLEKQERQRRDAERRRQEEQRRRDEEAARVQELDRQLAAAAKARDIRAYVAAVRASVGTDASTPALGAWLAWADAYADRLDPIRRLVSGDAPPLPPGSAPGPTP